MLTDDENIVDVQCGVQYILKSPTDYLFNNRSPDDSVLQAAETAIREVVGRSSMDFVLYEGRADVAARAHKLMQQILDRYGTGINISKVTMQDAQPPQQVQAAFNDAVEAGQDRERQNNEGQSYANGVIPESARHGGAADAGSRGLSAESRRAGGGATPRVPPSSRVVKAPQVTRDRSTSRPWSKIMTNTTKVMIDQSRAANNLLYPAPRRLMQMDGVPAVRALRPTRAPAPADSPLRVRARPSGRARRAPAMKA